MIKHRIIQLIEQKRITRAVFFKETTIKRGMLDTDKLEKSVSDISIAKIFATYPDINLEWLITGEGEMLRSPAIGVPGTEQCKTCDILKQEINELKQDKKMLMGSLGDKDELISILKNDMASMRKDTAV